MESCLIQLIVPQGTGNGIAEWLEDDIIDFWTVELDDEHVQHNIISYSNKVELIIDKLDNRYRQHPQYRLVMSKLGICLPEPKIEEQPEDKQTATNNQIKPPKSGSRTISRQELVATLSSSTKLNATYIMMLLLSVAVAIVGLLNNNIAVVIAAMVIAPLLGPNITLALATSMVDYQLGGRAVLVGSFGAALALIIALILGKTLPPDSLYSVEIMNRTNITYGDFILALAAGAAGTLAFTTGGSGTLIGVMVAVALLPPLLVFGLKFGSGETEQAFRAGLLFTVNFIGVNLAAVLTFVIQGIRPQGWWQANKARKTSVIAIIAWAILLIGLLITIYLYNQDSIQLNVTTPANSLSSMHFD